MRSFFVLIALIVTLLLSAGEYAVATAPPSSLTIARAAGPGTTVDLLWNPGGGAPHLYRIYASHAYPVPLISPIYTISTPSQQIPMGSSPPYFYVVTDDDGSSGESVASNTVGYTQVDGIGGIGNCYTYFGVAFKVWDGNGRTYGTTSTAPSDLFTDQLRCGTPPVADRIVNLYSGAFGFRSIACVWTGVLETSAGMGPGQGHALGILSNNSPRSAVVCGEADITGNYGTTTVPPQVGSFPGASYIAWRDPRVLQINQLELINDGFQGGNGYSDSDRLISLGPVDAGAIAYYDINSAVFAGDLTQIVPGQLYLIENVHATAFNYSFNALLIP